MICRPIASIFYDEVQFGDQMDRTTVGGRISCLRLHFVYFENWLFLKLLIIKSIFFLNRVLYFIIFQNGDAGCHYLKRKKQKENCKSVLIARLLSDQCILDSVEVYKKEPVKTPSLSCTVNIYYFLATENSGYFKLFSKTNQGLNKKRTIHTFSSLKRKEDLRSTPCNWHELISGSCNCLLSSQLDNNYFRSY